MEIKTRRDDSGAVTSMGKGCLGFLTLRERALRSYGYAVLAKPVAPQELAPRIEQILHEAARAQGA